MTKKIGIYDHTTGENIIREMTNLEIESYEKEATELAAEKAIVLANKEAAKNALLSSLKITEAQAIMLGLLPSLSNRVPTEHLQTIVPMEGAN